MFLDPQARYHSHEEDDGLGPTGDDASVRVLNAFAKSDCVGSGGGESTPAFVSTFNLPCRMIVPRHRIPPSQAKSAI